MYEHFTTLARPLALAAAQPPSWRERVRVQLLRRVADGKPAMAEVARALGVAPPLRALTGVGMASRPKRCAVEWPLARTARLVVHSPFCAAHVR
jgi:hypothetical protein